MTDLAPRDWNGLQIRKLERASIRRFVQACADAGMLSGRVLDFGCGQQPYRDIVEAAGGMYVGFDRVIFPASVAEENHGPALPLSKKWNAILCNQMLQYVPDYPEPGGTGIISGPASLLLAFRRALRAGGHLVLTGPTNWQEVERQDLQRHTADGIRHLLELAGFRDIAVESRAAVAIPDWKLSLGYGAHARA